MLNSEGMLADGKKARLTVVPMQGWKRSMTYDETGMPWILPSPHMPTAETTLYYPSSGIMGELDYISIGVGYTMPFRLFCAQWINAEKLTARLNALHIPGVKFRPIHIKPYYGFGKGLNLHGVEYIVTDAARAPLTMIQFYVAQELASMYPDKAMMKMAPAERMSMFNKVCGSKEISKRFAQRHKVADIQDYWNKDVESFRKTSLKYRLY